MYPEEKAFVLEPARIHRILRKLLGKVGDLEEEVLLRPSVYKTNDVFSGSNSLPHRRGSSNRGNSDTSGGEFSDSLRSSCGGNYCNKPSEVGGGMRMPPAHPFQHLIARGTRQAPRYTYRRGKMSSLSGSEYTDTEDGNKLSGGAKRGRPKALSRRSSSLGALSDDSMSQSGSQDPALWLTTPRKRLRRRTSETFGVCDAEKVRPGAQPQSFSSRLEKMITNPEMGCSNTYKARSLHSHLVGLGEMLWLGCPSSSDRCAVRVLPLKVLAAFRLGEAVAASDGCSDLDYLDEVYGAMPVFLVRFALWQHIVTLCYMRIPAYADTLSEALWDVGAFQQQQWLISARLADLDAVGALLKPGCIVPLHLRAVDISAEPWFVAGLLDCLSSGGAATNNEGAADATRVKRKHALWREFVLPGALPSAATCGETTYDSYSRIHGNTLGAMPSRFSKWVARISNSAQSVRLLATALEQALQFLVNLGGIGGEACGTTLSEAGISLVYADHFSGISCFEAVEAVKAISSIVYTKLGHLDSALSGSNAIVILECLQRCVVLLGRITGVCQADRRQKFGGDVVEACATCQTGLVLLALRQLGASKTEQPICLYSSVGQTWAQMASAAKKLLHFTTDNKIEHCGLENMDRNIDLTISKRSMLVARFDSAMSSSQSLEKGCAAGRKYRFLEMALQHLILAGASPGFFYDIAQLVAYDLNRPRAAKIVVSQTLVRFDAIWDQHRECRGWQQNWTQLQVELSVPGAQEKELKERGGLHGAMDELELWKQKADVARSRLLELSEDLDRRLASKAEAAAAAAANGHRRGSIKLKKQTAKSPVVRMDTPQRPAVVAEDELGMMLSLTRRRSPT